ncbi:hypothetical protein MKW94_015310 [Papaver nudicaule]|uniref:Uncharacterized protein n=1 Tax=Papaver nudicaule TaxID=74823 RepID=A0AA41VVB0_PAPNU|nr:hypothetical protein [Papaver nudicaule]
MYFFLQFLFITCNLILIVKSQLGEKMTAHDPAKKDMATKKKEEKKHEAEMNKEMIHDENQELKEERRQSASGVHKGGVSGGQEVRSTEI